MSDPTTNGNDCSPETTDWITLISSIITICVSWWAFELPTLFAQGWPNGKTVKAYWLSVQWNCFRVCMPGYAFLVVVWNREAPHREWSRRLYSPHTMELDDKKTLSTFGLIKSLLFESFGIIGVAASISRLWTLTPGDKLEGMNTSTWTFPVLPAAVLGLWTHAAGALKISRAWTTLNGFILSLSVIGIIAIAIHFSHQPWTAGLVAGLYVSIALPFALPAFFCAPLILQIQYIIVALVRVIGMVLGATSKGDTFPFCNLSGAKFAVPYFVLGVIAAVFGWLDGRHYVPILWRWQREFNARESARHRTHGTTALPNDGNAPARPLTSKSQPHPLPSWDRLQPIQAAHIKGQPTESVCTVPEHPQTAYIEPESTYTVNRKPLPSQRSSRSGQTYSRVTPFDDNSYLDHNGIEQQRQS